MRNMPVNISAENGYRPNVGLMILNDRFEVFMGHRLGNTWEFPYQMPQGGIDAGETPLEAAWRELFEETGFTPETCKLIFISRHWYQYNFPNQKKLYGFKGQSQKWFLFFAKNENAVCLNHQKHPEFNGFKWIPWNQICDMVVPFKRKVYRQVQQEFQSVLTKLADDKFIETFF